ncbi:hypothetical protein DdX_13141 [Ditylenchus destructor]|uniref:Uncharacterized protein n=1 Tax=Ditylenchus destructor TaxID=166010 RepID=A0AAD4MU53_9BILA|nr:hypothetical protein DdX_13141 [Ditylenchus destructor]
MDKLDKAVETLNRIETGLTIGGCVDTRADLKGKIISYCNEGSVKAVHQPGELPKISGESQTEIVCETKWTNPFKETCTYKDGSKSTCLGIGSRKICYNTEPDGSSGFSACREKGIAYAHEGVSTYACGDIMLRNKKNNNLTPTLPPPTFPSHSSDGPRFTGGMNSDGGISVGVQCVIL